MDNLSETIKYIIIKINNDGKIFYLLDLSTNNYTESIDKAYRGKKNEILSKYFEILANQSKENTTDTNKKYELIEVKETFSRVDLKIEKKPVKRGGIITQ